MAKRLLAVAALILLAIGITGRQPSTVSARAFHRAQAPSRPALLPGIRAYALGDSVMLGAQYELQRRGIIVDAVKSRQFIQGIYIMRYLRATGRLPNQVVIDLGTNGPFSSASFDLMMQVLRGIPRVVFVTVKEPRWWQYQVNAVIRAGVARWPNARLVDWYSAASLHPGWTCCDGIHLTPAGAAAYAQLVSFALR